MSHLNTSSVTTIQQCIVYRYDTLLHYYYTCSAVPASVPRRAHCYRLVENSRGPTRNRLVGYQPGRLRLRTYTLRDQFALQQHESLRVQRGIA